MQRWKKIGPVLALVGVCVMAAAYTGAIPTAEQQQRLPDQVGDLSAVSRVEISDGSAIVLSGEFGSEVADGDEVKRESTLTPTAGATASGEAEIEMDAANRLDQELEVEVQGLAPRQTYEIRLDGQPVGPLSTDARGRAGVEFSRTGGVASK